MFCCVRQMFRFRATSKVVEIKILRRIHGPVVEQGIWMVRTDHELRELHKVVQI